MKIIERDSDHGSHETSGKKKEEMCVIGNIHAFDEQKFGKILLT